MTAAQGAAQVIAALARTQTSTDLPVRLRAWDGSEAGPADAPVLIVRSPRALGRILWRPGELGLARAYISGDLDLDGDLTDALHRIRAAAAPHNQPATTYNRPATTYNRPATTYHPRRRAPAAWAALRAAARLNVPLWPPPPAPDCELKVRGRRHSRSRDQAVIAGHYDLTAEFYRLILDPAMAYSCADWTQADTLAGAQRDKLELICRTLALEPGRTLLDLGCGWGSLTVHAARDHRAQVTAVTLSAEQGGYVRRRAAGLGLANKIDVRIQDYRDPLYGPYDAIASVEMGEHVGAAQYPRFCADLYRLLRPGGWLLIQQMSRVDRAPGGGPFIESYIAPDMHMRPAGETARLLQDAGFEVTAILPMREHYVRTIRAWLTNFEANLPEIAKILTEEQVRVWRLYLAGSALAFEEGRMGVDQFVAVKPK